MECGVLLVLIRSSRESWAPAGLAISLARLGDGLGIRGGPDSRQAHKADDAANCEMSMARCEG